ncbi:MAG: glycerate-2-kinase family protein, partial [Dysosmobacter sp.]|nr:glycerate-2-kinase family protein [Dysosmobacter sp.]
MTELRRHAEQIYGEAIRRARPDVAVKEALRGFRPGPGQTLLIAVGKAAWRMASAALEAVDADGGLVVTKYGHSQGPLPGLEILEAGHPVADAASFAAAERALALVRGLGEGDSVLFLLSGGGSALFESSDLPLEEFQDINRRLLSCGADIQEINRVRKRLSNIKG